MDEACSSSGERRSLTVIQMINAWGRAGRPGESVSGPERRTANLAPRWVEAGVKTVICYPRSGRLWRQMAAPGVEMIDYQIRGKFDWRAVKTIAEIARSRQARVIHTQGPAALDLLAVLAARRAGIGSVVGRPVMIEDQVSYSTIRRRIYSLVDRRVTLSLAGRIVAVSEQGLGHLCRVSGVKPSRLRLIHNGVDLSRFLPKSASSADGSTAWPPVTIGMIGHLLPYKGWPDFIKVIRRLRDEGLNVRAIAFGEGAQRADLIQMATALGLAEFVDFRRFTQDVAGALREMDLFLMTSLREGLSVAIIEAMATGLPIVATEVGGIREQVVESRNGRVLPVHDVEGMTRACSEIIRSPALRNTMGGESRKLSEGRFSEQRMFEQYVDCYREAAACPMEKIVSG